MCNTFFAWWLTPFDQVDRLTAELYVILLSFRRDLQSISHDYEWINVTNYFFQKQIVLPSLLMTRHKEAGLPLHQGQLPPSNVLPPIALWELQQWPVRRMDRGQMSYRSVIKVSDIIINTVGPQFTGPRFTWTPINQEDFFPPIFLQFARSNGDHVSVRFGSSNLR